MAVSGRKPTLPLVEFTLELLKGLMVALVWMAIITAMLAGFGDYNPPQYFTVHAGEVQR